MTTTQLRTGNLNGATNFIEGLDIGVQFHTASMHTNLLSTTNSCLEGAGYQPKLHNFYNVATGDLFFV